MANVEFRFANWQIRNQRDQILRIRYLDFPMDKNVISSSAAEGSSLSPRERAGVRILRNGISRIGPLNLSTPKGLRPLAQGCEERATLGTNAKKSFSLSSRSGRRGPGRGGVPWGTFMVRGESRVSSPI